MRPERKPRAKQSILRKQRLTLVSPDDGALTDVERNRRESLARRAEVLATTAEPGELQLIAQAVIARAGRRELGVVVIALVLRAGALCHDAVVRAARWLHARWRRA